MRIAIIGAGGHAKVVADAVNSMGYDIGLFVSNDGKSSHYGLPVVGFEEFLRSPFRVAALGIGDNGARKRVYDDLIDKGIEFPPIIHSSAIISDSAQIWDGAVVMAMSVINAEAKIGIGAIINTASVIEHDCHIGEFAHISPKAALAGGVIVGERSHVGIGASAIQGVKIGKYCRIGAGAAVISDIEDNETAVGVPAKVLGRG